jgi:hypothetical protein
MRFASSSAKFPIPNKPVHNWPSTEKHSNQRQRLQRRPQECETGLISANILEDGNREDFLHDCHPHCL